MADTPCNQPSLTPNALGERLRKSALATLEQLHWKPDAALLARAKILAGELREAREFALLGQLTEAIGRCDPGDARIRRLYAQSLIETGHATAAIDVLAALERRLKPDQPEWAEVKGLTGRAWKQIYYDTDDKTAPPAREALKRAIEQYRAPYEKDAVANSWHGVNLAALLTAARSVGLRYARDHDPGAIARSVVDELERTPPEKRDNWYHATAAEAYLALGDWDALERHLGQYVQDARTTAFNLGSTRRQLLEVWRLDERGPRGKDLLAALAARTVGSPDGGVRLDPGELQRTAAQPEPGKEQLEALLGRDGPVLFRWWQEGTRRALAVASFSLPATGRFGSGFLVRGGDLAPALGDELLVLTNYHVINAQGAEDAQTPVGVEVAFEAGDPVVRFAVSEIVWSSPVSRHDASLVRLSAQPVGITPMPLAPALPLLDQGGRVYVIGYPGGRDLSVSLQDNELLDHEGPSAGTPPDPDVIRVHYRTPTEPGSSGSPVFNQSSWQVIGLHHMGGDLMTRLNGRAGTYPANEGVWIRSIAAAATRELAGPASGR